jgi:hypothetical protein
MEGEGREPLMRYHHIGIPTTRALPAEDYRPEWKLTASGYFASRYGIEWMAFDADCPLPELIRTVPHVAFVVEDLEAALVGQELLMAPSSPADGVRVAFIVENGAPVELLEFSRPEEEVWPRPAG